ncbi:MAG TPA: TetR/AcrR family transcriptional regulator [Polyangiales bacterium]|jgi:AcrR family transcriptional regulator|nr:TetR/AcrR family transcriptional regulator [Polyangiales bacterium]
MKKVDPANEAGGRAIRRRNPEESKRRILDAAERAFARRGFEGARLRDIASDAGVHHALVHHYYGDKRGLFKEVLERALATISSAGLESLAGANDLESTVTHLVSALHDFMSTQRDLLHIIENAYRDKDGVAHELTTASLGSLAAPLIVHVRGRIVDGQKVGVVRNDITPDALIVFGFSVIAHPFVSGAGIMRSLGLPSISDDELAARKGQLASYIIAAMKPPR